MVSTINVNIFSKDNVTLLNEQYKELNKADLKLISILNEKTEKVKVLDYQANNKSYSVLKEAKKISYQGVNYEYAFCNENINYVKDIYELKVNADVVISINTAHRKKEIKEFLNEVLSLNAKEFYIIFPCSNVAAMKLNDDIRIEHLENDSMFIKNIYSHDSIKQISNDLNINYEIFTNEDNNDFALLSFIKSEKKEKIKIK